MTSRSGGSLYTPNLLALAVELAEYPYDPEAQLTGYARSRTCGSEVWISCHADEHGALRNFGLKVTACAVGQASAALFANFAPGKDSDEIGSMLHGIGSWLDGEAPSSILPRLELLEGALPHKGRHEAILLPWRAALDALSKAGRGG